MCIRDSGKVVRANYFPEGGSAELPSGWWFGGISPGKVVRPNDFPEGGSAELLSGRVRANYVLSGRWFGRITFGKVVRRNYAREGGSDQLLSGRWFGRNTFWMAYVIMPTFISSVGQPHRKG